MSRPGQSNGAITRLTIAITLIRMFIDGGLERYGTIYPAAGTTSSGVPMTFAQLVAITGGTVGDFLEDGEGA